MIGEIERSVTSWRGEQWRDNKEKKKGRKKNEMRLLRVREVSPMRVAVGWHDTPKQKRDIHQELDCRLSADVAFLLTVKEFLIIPVRWLYANAKNFWSV
jgi:hypothetical protein